MKSSQVTGTFCSSDSKPHTPDLTLRRLDFADSGSVSQCLEETRPAIIVNLAAMSSPAECERDPAAARCANVPGSLLQEMRRCCPEALFIQFSTDQVFGGDKAPYSEQDEVDPVNVYGSTKADFEGMIRSDWPNHYILRSSLIIGPSTPRPCRKSTFVHFLEEKLSQPGRVSLWHDEVRCPIHVEDVVRVVMVGRQVS
mmetsp:Transcript_70799/g.166967  ORF Transcript_70799/g.166967 Transcript_70799/m.166967 type:complete len:198 (-) Transcript_70799:323-916(-)